MARIESFQRDLQMATAGIAPDAIAGQLAKFARAELSKAIAEGEGSSIYDKFVNGRKGADEESVILPGPILYVFSWWDEVVNFALQFLRDRSPVKDGDYKRAWQVRVSDSIVDDPKRIPLSAEVLIVNPLPYARKIDVGHMRMSVPPFLLEDSRRAVMARFGNLVMARRVMVLLPGGYVLKGHFTRGIRPHARRKLQRDTRAGALMTYPALKLTMRAA